MERRHFFRCILFSTLSLGLEGRARLLASTDRERVRVRAPREPWEKVEFSYTEGQQTYPGIAVRLPGKSNTANGNPGEIYAACRICPHQGCPFTYEVEYRKIGDMVGASLENPVFFCRCHMSIFDPAQRGKVIFGPANRPPWIFSFQPEKNEIIIIGVEKGVGQFS